MRAVLPDCMSSTVVDTHYSTNQFISLLQKVLLIEKSKSSTWMELEHELSKAISSLKDCGLEDLGGRTNISLGSGCDIFMKFVTRAFKLEFAVRKFDIIRKILGPSSQKHLENKFSTLYQLEKCFCRNTKILLFRSMVFTLDIEDI